MTTATETTYQLIETGRLFPSPNQPPKYHYGSWSSWGLKPLHPCPQCSLPQPVSVGSLVALGEVLDGVKKVEHRGCPANPPPPPPAAAPPEPARPPTTAEQLLAVLDQYIAERMVQP